jgi:uncharacterized hydrophobic protein (TIGR00271 family)
MYRLEICSPTDRTDSVLDVLSGSSAVTSLVVHRGASVRPAGDVIAADVPRESADALLDAVFATGVQEEGAVHLDPVTTWVSRPAFTAMLQAPGSSTDALVWPEVVQRSYDETELNRTYLWFMTLATLIAAIAIKLDSQILVIGAMVLGPEFVPIAALGVALLRRRRTLLLQATRTLVLGFVVAILATTVIAWVGRAAGWIDAADLLRPRPATAFIYTPDRWSLIVSLIAGVAGVLSLASARTGALVGVFISVTTIPAGGNIALALAFRVWSEVWGSSLQLFVNITGMAIAGALTLWLRQAVWDRSLLPSRLIPRRPHDDPRLR